jgi:uncharacterized protein (DUF2147 family)
MGLASYSETHLAPGDSCPDCGGVLGLRAPRRLSLLFHAHWRLACANKARCRFSVPVPLLGHRPPWAFRFVSGLLLVSLPVLAMAPLHAAPKPSPEGYWLTNGFVVRISQCGTSFCGELVGLNRSDRPDAVRLDGRNKDLGQRTRPLCGIDLLGGFRPSKREANKWEGGWIYNPDDGKTYSSEVRLQGPNMLKARGYVLVPLFGRDITLLRESTPTARCPGTAP